MNLRLVARAVAVFLALVALGAGAATLDSGTAPDLSPPDYSGPSPDVPWGERGSEQVPAFGLPNIPVLVVVLGGLVALAALAARIAESVRAAVLPLGFLVTFLVMALVAWQSSLYLALRTPWADLPRIAPPRVALVGGLLAVVAGVVLVGLRPSGGSSVVAPRGEDGGANLAAVGRAAGDAADRIDRDADVTNEVYRAWRQMATGLDVSNPDARSPAEFAAAASDAGMARDHVSTLTRLFREVRYGGLDPDERAERAVEALRRIEDAYGGDDR